MLENSKDDAADTFTYFKEENFSRTTFFVSFNKYLCSSLLLLCLMNALFSCFLNVPVHNNAMRFVASSGFVKHHQVVFDHSGELLNNLHPVGLHADGGRVS